MRRSLTLVSVVSLGLVLFGGASAACNTKAFDESFCTSYKESFVKSCTDTCAAKSGKRELCEPRCGEALVTDATFSSRCKETAAGKAAASTP